MLIVEIEVVKATVLLMPGADKISLHTNLPSPMPAVSEQPLALDFDAAHDTGIEYVKNIFDIEPEVISARQRSKPGSGGL